MGYNEAAKLIDQVELNYIETYGEKPAAYLMRQFMRMMLQEFMVGYLDADRINKIIINEAKQKQSCQTK
jgi:hypothetical protein